MSRPHPALVEVAAGRPLTRIPEPENLIRSAFEHKMGGLLWTRVLEHELALDAATRNVLFQHDVRNWARHTRLRDGSVRLVSRLRSLGVTACVVKGTTIEQRWYTRTGERPFFDIDILIDPADDGRFGDIVRTLTPGHPLAASVNTLIAQHRLFSVNLEYDSMPVDMHSDVLKLDLLGSRQRQRIWTRRVALGLDESSRLDALDAEASLIQLLLQLNKDSFAYLLGFSDIARIAQSADLDWAFVEDFLREEGLRTQMSLTLQAVAEALRLRLPLISRSHGWRGVVWDAVWPPGKRLDGDASIVRAQRRSWWLALTAERRTREALGALAGRICPPRSLLDYYYPTTRGPYLWRLITGRLTGAFARRRLLANVDTLRRDPVRDDHNADRMP